MKKTEKALLERDAKRDIGAELLASVREMKADERARERPVGLSDASEARRRTGLSWARFAALLGMSKRTPQDWERGRREPSGRQGR